MGKREDLELRVISLSLQEEPRKPKQVRVDLQVTKKGLLSGVYPIQVPLKDVLKFRLDERYSASMGVIASADFPGDNPKTMRIATQSYEILEVRNKKGERVYSRNLEIF